MAALAVERARANQRLGLEGGEANNVSITLVPTRPKGSGQSGPLKYLFSDKHTQRSPRFQLQQQQQLDSPQEGSRILQEQQQQERHAASQRHFLQPKHKALAARLAAATERQQRRQQHQQQQQQQGVGGSSRHGCFSPKVAADIAVVVGEVGLPQSVAAALTTAAAKGQVSCNPGILLSQLLRLLPLQPDLCAMLGRQDSLAVLLSAQPSLLRSDPASLQANCRHLQELLGQQAAAAATQRCPQILGCSPFRVSANLTTLQDLLGYGSPAAAAAVAVRQPMLLLCGADNLRLRWQQLRQLMAAVPEEKLSKQLRRTPELLMMRPSTLAAKLRGLDLLFAPTSKQQQAASAPAAVAAAAGPARKQQAASPGAAASAGADAASGQQQQKQKQRLLGVYKQHQLSYRLQRLQQLAAAQHGSTQQSWGGHYGYGPSSSSSSSSSTSSSTGGSSPAETTSAAAAAAAAGDDRLQQQGGSVTHTDPRVQHLALKVPGLLLLNPGTLHSNVVELQLLLALQPDDPRLSRLVLLQPGLLTQAPRTLANKVQLLQHLTGRGEGYVLEMVLRCPAVLTLSPEGVSRKWGLLQRCVGACALWKQQLAAAPPVSVAMMLCYSIQRLHRLQYVVQLSQQHQQQQQQRQGTVGEAGPEVCDATVSSSSGSGSGSSTGRRRRRASLPAGADTTSSSSSADSDVAGGMLSRVEQQQQQQRRRQQQQAAVPELASVPWRSVVQEAEAVFCERFPGYKAWQQQQQQV